MTPLFVYITRPDAYEVYMGGKRHLELWLLPPAYDHRSVEYNGMDGVMYTDRGWCTVDTSQQARHLLAHDKDLTVAIMREVILSLYPKGIDSLQGEAWAAAADLEAERQDGHPAENNWRRLRSDREWEAKCNTCFKRFLLKVDLRSNTVQRIIPQVIYTMEQRNAGRDLGRTDHIETIDIFPRLRDFAGLDHIPF